MWETLPRSFGVVIADAPLFAGYPPQRPRQSEGAAGFVVTAVEQTGEARAKQSRYVWYVYTGTAPLDPSLRKAFIVYLLSHYCPMLEVLAPTR